MSRRPPRKAIIHPAIDLLCCGGLSIVVFGGILIWGNSFPNSVEVGPDSRLVFVLSLLLNWPHFMASYRLMYATRNNLSESRVSAIWVPALLLSLITLEFGFPNHGGLAANAIFIAAAALLGWHYTGQTWGMVAVFSNLAGARFEDRERKLIRGGLDCLLCFHVFWSVLDFGISKKYHWHVYFDVAYLVVAVIAATSFLAGAVGFYLQWRRSETRPSLRALTAWFAVYVWYVTLFFYPFTFLFLQMAHALQYLWFPLRVEINRRRDHGRSRVIFSIIYYATLVLVGFLVFELPYKVVAANGGYLLLALVSASISIHHYFIDAAIWRISNPVVSRDLFSHLAAAE